MKKFVVAAAMLVGSSGVYADGHGHHMRFDYDVSFDYNDHGYSKTDGYTPAKTTHVDQKSYLNFSGKVDDTLSYETYINILAGSLDAATEVAKATKKMGMFSLAVGRDYLTMGGYDAKNANFATIVLSPYTKYNLPAIGPNQVRFEGDFGGAGKVSFSLAQDKVYSTAKTDTLQPAMLLEWTGTFGPVMPLVQIVQYDTNHSQQIAIGAGVQAAGLTAYLDYVMDSRASAPVGDASREKTSYSSIAVDVKYHTAAAVPFFKYTTFDAAQPGTDVKGNASTSGYEDNGQSMTLGVEMPCSGESFLPYVAYVSNSQKVIEGTEEKSKSQSSILLGFSGSI